jgi:hypothetical protein
MNISSLYRYGTAAIMPTNNVSQLNNTTNITFQTDQILGISSTDGDSFQLSSPTLGFMSYNSSGAVSGTSNIKTDLASFLDAVKNGTATDADVKKI